MAEKAAKKPLKRPATKAKAKKPVKQKAPEITGAMFEEWYFKQERPAFIRMQKQWNEKNLKIELPNHHDYDGWLNYFKGLPPNTIKVLAATGLDILTTEAYAALSRWHDIISNPHRIEKIHQSGLTTPSKDKEKTIVQLAKENDRLGVLMATRDAIAEKIAKGAGARDTAALARELTDVMSQIDAYTKKLKPGKETMLGRLTEGMPTNLKKRPGKNGGGVRNTSFQSRVTIKDLEGDE